MQSLSKSETIKLREKHVGAACQLFFRADPLHIVRAEGQYMYDESGRRYLDCINNVAHVGHCHPHVVEAARAQMSLVGTNSRFLHCGLPRLAARLAALLPPPLEVAFLVNSGSEANDLALRLAHAHTRRTDVVVLDHAYHGHLSNLIAVSPYKHNLPGAPLKPDWVHVAPVPDTYRGVYRRRSSGIDAAEQAALTRRYAAAVRARCDAAAARGGLSAFIAETLQSCGGQIVPPPGYLRQVYDAVRSLGGVCIADEVQTGFGRCGAHWWAFQAQGVVPDIVTMGKPMGNGHPVAAVITTRAIADSFHHTGIEYFNTYGGNPVSCAVAHAVLDVIEEEGLLGQAAAVGAALLARGERLGARHPLVGDVRGLGLFLGIELVTDRATRAPATAEADHIVNRMRTEGVLISRDGPDGNVLKLKPPMVFTLADAERAMDVLERALTELEGGRTAATTPPPTPLQLQVRVTSLDELPARAQQAAAATAATATAL